MHALGAPVRIDGESYAVVLAGPARRIESTLKTNAAALLRTVKALEAKR